MSYRQELGQIIRKHRKAKHMSQEQLAEKCNLSLHQISDIENGKVNLKYDTLMKICAVCDIETGSLPRWREKVIIRKEAVPV